MADTRRERSALRVTWCLAAGRYAPRMPRARVIVVADAVVVLALCGTAILQLWNSPPAGLSGPVAVHYLLAAAGTLPLLVRRTLAVPAFVSVVAASWLQYQLGAGLGQPFFAMLIALYAVGAHVSPPLAYIGPAAVVSQVLLVDVARLRAGTPWDDVVPAWVVMLGSWAFGVWMRQRARATTALTERVEAAERDIHERTARAVEEERSRIARELHDLVAHNMGVIVIQAQAAQRAMDSAPDRALEALISIESAGRSGLAEMRRLLGLLTDGDDDADTTPQPTLHQVPDLVARLKATGMPVSLTVEGVQRTLPASLELTGFRVVQEALTNTLKHAGPVRAEVRLRYERDWLDVHVTDDGPDSHRPAASDTGLRGLVGMRERVSLFGGSLWTGPRPDRAGFLVHARLPVEGGAS